MTTENDTNLWNVAIGSFFALLGGVQLWVIKVISRLPFNYTLKEDHKADIDRIETTIKDGFKSMKADNDILHGRINEVIKKK